MRRILRLYLFLITLLEKPQTSNIGNEEDSEAVPIPDYPGVLVFLEVVPAIPPTETSDKEYMADVMGILKDKPVIYVSVFFQDLCHNFHSAVFYTYLKVSFKIADGGETNGPIEMLTSVEEEQLHSETSDRPQSDASETEQQATDVTVVAQAFNIEETMVISPGN